MGFLSHPQNRQFSVTGDLVNEANRIGSYTKENGTDILISDFLLKNLPKDLLILVNTLERMLPGLFKKTVMIVAKDFAKSDLQLQLQSLLNLLLKEEDVFAQIFHKKVFEKVHHVRALFTKDMLAQGRFFTHMLGSIVYFLKSTRISIDGADKVR